MNKDVLLIVTDPDDHDVISRALSDHGFRSIFADTNLNEEEFSQLIDQNKTKVAIVGEPENLAAFEENTICREICNLLAIKHVYTIGWFCGEQHHAMNAAANVTWREGVGQLVQVLTGAIQETD